MQTLTGKMATNSRTFISTFQEALRDIIRQLANADLDKEKVDDIIFRLDQLSVHLVHCHASPKLQRYF